MKLFGLVGQKVSIPETGDGWVWQSEEFEAHLTRFKPRPRIPGRGWRFWWSCGTYSGSGSAREKDEALALLMQSITRSWGKMVRAEAVLNRVVRWPA